MTPDTTDVTNHLERIVESGVVHGIDTARVITEGSQHLVVIVNDTLVARFPKDEPARASIHTEVEMLRGLADQITAPIPVPIHVDDDFTVHHMFHGSSTTKTALDRLDPDRAHRLLDDIAQFLAELHTATITDPAPSPATTSPTRLDRLKQRATQHVVPHLWQHQREWLDDLFHAIEETKFDTTPTLIHGDLAPYHILHDPSTGALTGIIDFGVAGLGDPAVDLSCLLITWGERACSDLLALHTGDQQLLQRARLLAAVLPLEWATLAIEHDAPDMAVAHLGHAALDIHPTVGRATP